MCFSSDFLHFVSIEKNTNSQHSSEPVTDESKKHVALYSTVISGLIIGPSDLIYLMFTYVNNTHFVPSMSVGMCLPQFLS